MNERVISQWGSYLRLQTCLLHIGYFYHEIEAHSDNPLKFDIFLK